MMIMRYLFFFTLGLLFGFPSGWAQDISPDSSLLLKVGVKPSPPFVFKKSNGEWMGISIYLWEEIAKQEGWNFEYQEKSNLAELLDCLDKNSIDLTINPLTVNSERINYLHFTQPFYIANSVVAVPYKAKDKWSDIISKFFSWQLLQVVFFISLIVFVGGAGVWFFERKKNEQFSGSWRGLWSGIWWSAATVTSVGYGDKAPQTFPGQLVGVVWMFIGILLVSSFVAGITSVLTVEQLDDEWRDLSTLRQVRVGAVKKSASSSFLSNSLIKNKEYEELLFGLEALQNNHIDAFVYDEPILRYELERQNLFDKIRVLPFKFNTQYYSFGLPKTSNLAERINPVLLKIVEDLRWKAVLAQYNLVEF